MERVRSLLRTLQDASNELGREVLSLPDERKGVIELTAATRKVLDGVHELEQALLYATE